jgi:cohesin complex subunit SCC1
VGDITLEEGQKAVETAMATEDKPAEEPMEVDQRPEQDGGGEAHNQTATSDQAAANTTLPEDEGGFILEPVDITSAVDTSVKGKKRKRRLVVDTDKEFTSDTIRSQLEDYSDTLQQKLFPPPTKKAMLWKDMTTCEQLFVRPVYPFIASEIYKIITRNYSTSVPGEATDESVLDLEQEEAPANVNATRDTTADIEKARQAEGESTVAGDVTGNPDTLLDGIGDGSTTLPLENDREHGMEDGMRPFDQDGVEFPPEGEGGPVSDEQTSRVIPDMPELEGISSEEAPSQTANGGEKEMSEEFEKRRWTKRTQQVLRMLGRSFSNNSETPFSTLTQKCNRKQAASRFYTCLLLAKENTIHVQQASAYGEILITKGPKFTKAF